MISYKSIGRMGRFANGAWEILGTIGTAIKSNQPFAFPLWINHDARDRFGSNEDPDIYKHFVNPLPLLGEGIAFQEYPYFWGYSDLTLPYGNWNLNAHFQSEKYFTHCMDQVRHYMTMIDEPTNYNAVALHIRRGDYDQSYHPILQAGYYHEALKHIPKDAEIFLFSDDFPAAHKVMKELGVTYVPIEKDYLESFKIMKRCKHFVCGNSSYSLLAAVLADQPEKVVVCPRNWFGPAWSDPVGMAKDIYPEGAIVT